jgi:pimeloyl-ACP methyl ester carboxylesterase
MIKIIAIHGFLGNNEMWKEILPSHFPFSFYTPQLAGHGNNDNLSSSSIEEFANHVLQQIEPNDSDEYIWIGHSMGGYVAAHLAKTFPAKTKALAFFHSTADADNELKKQDRLRAIEAAEKHKALYATNLIDGLFHDSDEHRFAINEQLEKIESMSAESIVQSLRAMRDRESSIPFLQTAEFPIHYFAGANDKVLSLDKMKVEWSFLQQAHITIIPEIGHMGHIEKPSAGKTFFEGVISAFAS